MIRMDKSTGQKRVKEDKYYQKNSFAKWICNNLQQEHSFTLSVRKYFGSVSFSIILIESMMELRLGQGNLGLVF